MYLEMATIDAPFCFITVKPRLFATLPFYHVLIIMLDRAKKKLCGGRRERNGRPGSKRWRIHWRRRNERLRPCQSSSALSKISMPGQRVHHSHTLSNKHKLFQLLFVDSNYFTFHHLLHKAQRYPVIFRYLVKNICCISLCAITYIYFVLILTENHLEISRHK